MSLSDVFRTALLSLSFCLIAFQVQESAAQPILEKKQPSESAMDCSDTRGYSIQTDASMPTLFVEAGAGQTNWTRWNRVEDTLPFGDVVQLDLNNRSAFTQVSEQRSSMSCMFKERTVDAQE